MSHRSSFLIIAVMLVSFASCSQSSTGIYQTYSFYKINMPGNIRVDDNGKLMNKRDTTREVYIVTKSSLAPEIIAVVKNTQYYYPIITKIDSGKIYVGEKLADGNRVELNSKTGYTIWKIGIGNAMTDLVIIKEKSAPAFYLYIKHKGKNSIHEIKSSIELVPDLNY